MDRSRMLPTSTDLLSPQGGDQGFVSPGDHLLSPLGDHQGLLSLGKPGLSLQVNKITENILLSTCGLSTQNVVTSWI